jgi:hypothetical protein
MIDAIVVGTSETATGLTILYMVEIHDAVQSRFLQFMYREVGNRTRHSGQMPQEVTKGDSWWEITGLV